jgi:hypothetical protein
MSKSTVSAAGGAMPASGQPNIAEAFEETRSLIHAASSLAVTEDDIHSVISAAEDKFAIAFEWFKAGHEQRVSAPVASPAGPDPDYELLRIVDAIYPIRCLVEAAWMAATDLTKEQCGAMQTVLGEAQERLLAVRDKLNIARGAPVEDRDDV